MVWKTWKKNSSEREFKGTQRKPKRKTTKQNFVQTNNDKVLEINSLKHNFFHPLIEDTEIYEKINSHPKCPTVEGDRKKKPDKTHKDIKDKNNTIVEKLKEKLFLAKVIDGLEESAKPAKENTTKIVMMLEQDIIEPPSLMEVDSSFASQLEVEQGCLAEHSQKEYAEGIIREPLPHGWINMFKSTQIFKKFQQQKICTEFFPGHLRRKVFGPYRNFPTLVKNFKKT